MGEFLFLNMFNLVSGNVMRNFLVFFMGVSFYIIVFIVV